MKALVTGGAGFIGSSLTEALARLEWNVTVLDNLSSGSKRNLEPVLRGQWGNRVRIIVGDCTEPGTLRRAVGNCDAIFHFAANPEVRIDLASPSQCFRENVLATYVLLEAFKRSKATSMVFASTSTVYGEPSMMPTPENYSPLEPISIYAGSKLAGEALVGSFCHTFGKSATILRFANVVGQRSKRGVITDFVAKLHRDHLRLKVLGDGTQKKSYIYIDDCIEAILAAFTSSSLSVEVYNVGSEDHIDVRTVATIVAEEMGLSKVQLEMDGSRFGGRGWLGDVKKMCLDIHKLKSRGWNPKFTSREAVRIAARSILAGSSDLPSNRPSRLLKS